MKKFGDLMLYTFDSFEINSDKFELRREGKLQHVERLVFNLILFLVQNPGKVISREEIVDEVWGGRIVSDTTISTAIKSARKVLGDDGDQQKIIKTIRGRGVHFLSDVKVGGNDSKEKTNPHTMSPISSVTFKLAIIGALLLFILILFLNRSPSQMGSDGAVLSQTDSPYSVAIMPFVDMSAGKNQAYFGYGMAEEILNILAATEELEVTSRTSSFALQPENLTIPEIADRLDVNYIVEGSIQEANNRIRVTAKLIEVSNDNNLWSGTYDRELDDIFAVQDEISNEITTALKLELIGEPVTREAPTTNMVAYTLYLQGHELFLNRGRENIENAIDHLNRAIELDPNFAEAWADLASSYSVINSYGDVMDQALADKRAFDAATKATELNPMLAQGWAIRGYLHINEFERQNARTSLERATELDPKNESAWMWLGSTYTSTGFFDEATHAYKMAVELSPDSALNHGNLGRNYLMLGDLDNARTSIDTSIELGWWPASIERAAVALIDGDKQTAVSEYSKVITTFGEEPTSNLELYVDAYFNETLVPAAQARLAQDMEAGGLQAIFGTLLLLDGESFIRYVDENNVDIMITMSHLFRNPFRALLNQQPVKDHMIRTGLVDYWRADGWPPICQPSGNNDFECN